MLKANLLIRRRHAGLFTVALVLVAMGCGVDASSDDGALPNFEASSDGVMLPDVDDAPPSEEEASEEEYPASEQLLESAADDVDISVAAETVDLDVSEDAAIESTQTDGALPRCSHLDVCSDGGEILCPDGSTFEGQIAYSCVLQEEKDPSTGDRCMAWTWEFVAACNIDYPDWEDRIYRKKVEWQYYRGSKGHVYARHRTSSGGWSKAASLGGSVRHGPSVQTDANGLPVILITGTDGKLRLKRYLGGGNWSAWTTMGSALVSKAVLGKTNDGRLKIFGVTSKGKLYVRTQTSPGSKTWSGYVSLGEPSQGLDQWTHLYVLPNKNGKQEVFAVDDRWGTVAVRRETSGAPWVSLGAHTVGGVSTRPERLKYGWLKVVNGVVGNSHQRWMRYQTTVNSDAWADWTSCSVF